MVPFRSVWFVAGKEALKVEDHIISTEDLRESLFNGAEVMNMVTV